MLAFFSAGCFAELSPRLQTLPVVAGRLAEVLGAVAAEITQRGEVHLVGNLRERQSLVVEVFLQDGHRVAVNETTDAVSCDSLNCGGEVLRRHVQPPCIVAHFAFGAADTGGEQVGQLPDDIGGAVAVGIGGLAPGVKLEDVVYHCQTEAPHHLAVEGQVTVVHAVAQAVEVLQQDFRLSVVDLDDGILVKADASPDTVVVRRQQSAKELVVGGEPLHLHSRYGGEILGTGGVGHHHKVVFHDVVALPVEHKAALARRAQQVHAGVAQLRRVHREEISRVMKINLHNIKIRKLSIITENICGNCENIDVFCESFKSQNYCTFAS